MRRLTTLPAFVLMCLPVHSGLVQTTTPTTPSLTTGQLQSRLDEALAMPSIGENQKQQISELYTAAIRSLETAQQLQSETAAYRDAMDNATQAELDVQMEGAELHMPDESEFANASLPELRGLLAKEEAGTRAIRARIDELQEDIRTEQSTDFEAQLTQARQQLSDLSRPSNEPAANGGPGAQAQADSLQAQRVMLRARVNNLEQRLVSRGVRLRLMNLELDLRNKELASALAHQAALRELITGHRQSAAERIAREARDRVDELEDEPPQITRLATDNSALADRIATVVTRTEETIQQNVRMVKERDLIEKKREIVEQQLAVTTFLGSADFGIALRGQRDWLQRTAQETWSDRSFKTALTAARLEQMQVDTDLQPDLFPDQAAIEESVRIDSAAELSPQAATLINELLEQRRDLLQSLSSAYSEYIVALTGTRALQTVISDSIEQYAELINERLLWMPSARPVGPETLRQIKAVAIVLLAPDELQSVMSQLGRRIGTLAIPLAIAAILLLGLLLRRRALVRSLRAMAPRIGNVGSDRFSLTMLAVFQTLLLALPGPLLVALIGLTLTYPEPIAGRLGEVLIIASLIYFQMESILQAVRPGGLSGVHFKWDARTLDIIKRNLRWLIPLVVVFTTLSLLLGGLDLAEARHTIGRLGFVVLSLGWSLFAYLVLHPVRGIRPNVAARFLRGPLRKLIFWLGVGLPLVFAALSLIGYHYTAVDLEFKLMQTAGISVFAIFIFDLIVRALSISERRLALERLRAKRQAAAAQAGGRAAAEKAGEGVPDLIDADEMDIETISSQTRSLLTMLIGIGLIVGLSSIWVDVLPAFKVFDNITLWDVSRSIDGVSSLDPITLWDLMLALLIGFVTLFASRNLPGVLEVAVLNRLSLESGTSYAVTSVSRYFIVIVGTIAALQILGAEWSKLQWLIAALSVGLGFGLQEIVANFVSGIVILFEKPIRLADTVTIDGQTGTVTKIRIRATTITDWDRKELIIPNKTFITQQLVNWTLSDPVMRLIVRVGVAYGSDTELVEKTLLTAARSCTKALADPPPVAIFMSFGDSSLNFELRVFLRGIGDYVPLNHELHSKIDKAFREQGIEISFPQRDVHFDNPKPIEVQVVRRPDRTDPASPNAE